MKLVPAEVGRAENLVPRSRCWVKGPCGPGLGLWFKQMIGAGGTKVN